MKERKSFHPQLFEVTDPTRDFHNRNIYGKVIIFILSDLLRPFILLNYKRDQINPWTNISLYSNYDVFCGKKI